MSDLVNQQCEACKVGAPKLSAEDLAALKPQIPEWQVDNIEGVAQLSRTYSFKNFATAMAFANKVGDLAEAHNHHPAITVEWGRVKIAWWTHKIAGLHANDAILAAKTDAIPRER